MAIIFLGALELYPLLYSLDVPEEELKQQNKLLASENNPEYTQTGYDDLTYRGELTLGPNTITENPNFDTVLQRNFRRSLTATDFRADKDLSSTFTRI